jgi:hypothetical protein
MTSAAPTLEAAVAAPPAARKVATPQSFRKGFKVVNKKLETVGSCEAQERRGPSTSEHPARQQQAEVQSEDPLMAEAYTRMAKAHSKRAAAQPRMATAHPRIAGAHSKTSGAHQDRLDYFFEQGRRQFFLEQEAVSSSQVGPPLAEVSPLPQQPPVLLQSLFANVVHPHSFQQEKPSELLLPPSSAPPPPPGCWLPADEPWMVGMQGIAELQGIVNPIMDEAQEARRHERHRLSF